MTMEELVERLPRAIHYSTMPKRSIVFDNVETEHQRMARFFFTSEHDKVEKPRDIEALMHEQIGADPRVKSVGPISKAVAAMVPFRTAHGTEFPMYQLTRSGMRSYEAYGVRLEVRPHDVRLVDENGIVHEALTVPEAARSSLSIPHSPDRPSRDYRAVAVLATLELYAPRFEDDQATLRALSRT